jgi:hypothetical protein
MHRHRIRRVPIRPESKDTFADRFETTVGTRGSRNIEGQATVPAGLTDVAAISADFHPSLALGADGTVVAWGYNTEWEATVPGGSPTYWSVADGRQLPGRAQDAIH